jgi:hypothetical protein
MAGATLVSNSFNGGYTDDLVDARPDNQRRQAGCKRIYNTVAIAQGPATRRPGFRYNGTAWRQGAGTKTVQIPFIFSATEARVLEMSGGAGPAGGIGLVWLDDELVPDPGAPAFPYAFDHPYLDAELPFIRYRQSGDIIYIAHDRHPPGKITRRADNDWLYEVLTFTASEIPYPLGISVENVTKVESPGTQTYKYKVSAVDADTGKEGAPSGMVQIKDVSLLNSVDGNYNILSWTPVPLPVVVLEYRIYKYDAGSYGYIGRTTDISGGWSTLPLTGWVLDPVSGNYYKASGRKAPSAVRGFNATTRVYDTLTPYNGDGIMTSPWATLGALEWGYDIYATYEGLDYVRMWFGQNPNGKVSWPGLINGIWERVEKSDGRYQFIDDNIKADVADPPQGDQDPFANVDNYPALVFLWEQRLGWAASRNSPFGVYLSPSSQFESMSAGVPPTAEDAIEATLAAPQANRIQWIAEDRQLLVGTSGNEWTMGESDEPLSPVTPSGFKHQGRKGGENMEALSTGDALLFVQRGGNVVREMVYNYAGDKYASPDVSILASSLLDGRKIVKWCFQLNPYSIVWMVLDNGAMLGMTYIKEHEVVAWHSHDVGGYVEDIVCVPGEGYDRVSIVVHRYIPGIAGGGEGGWVRSIERMENFFIRQSDKTDAFFVDSGVTIENDPAVKTLTDAVPHLAGETVNIWADGVEHSSKVVGTTGTVELDIAAKKVQIGLPMTSELIPNRPEVLSKDGTTLTKNYKLSTAKLKLYKTAGVRVGTGEESESLEEILPYDAADPEGPQYVESGDVPVTIDSGWEDDWTLKIRTEGPAPMTVVAAVYEIEIGEKL